MSQQRKEKLLLSPLISSPIKDHYSSQVCLRTTSPNQVSLQSPSQHSCSTNALQIDKSQVDSLKQQNKDLYVEIQSLTEKKQQIIERHKDKYLKTTKTENLIIKELNAIDEELTTIKIKQDLEVCKKKAHQEKSEVQIKKIEREIVNSQDIHLDLENQVVKIERVIVGIQGERNSNGDFKYTNRQVELDQESLQEVESYIASLQKYQSQINEQYLMTEEDISSHTLRLLDIRKVIQYKEAKLNIQSKKIQNKKSKLYQEYLLEKQALQDFRQKGDISERIAIPALKCNQQVIMRLIDNLKQQLVECLNQKVFLLNRINENKCIDPVFDDNQLQISKLSIKKEHIMFKQVEIQEKIKLSKLKIQEIQGILKQEEVKVRALVEANKQKVQTLSQRQQQLLGYKEQICQVVKPSIQKLDSKVKSINKEIDKAKSKLIKVQKYLNSSCLTQDYQQLSSTFQGIELLKQFVDDEIVEQSSVEKLNEQLRLFNSNSQGQASSNSQQISSINIQIGHDIIQISEQSKEESDDDLLESKKEKLKYLQSQSEPLITYNNPDIYCRIKPLLKGIEVYKKQFDTKLLNLSQQHRYNPLINDKRITPDQLGYQLRVIKLQADDIWNLEIINGQEDMPRPEIVLDLAQVKVKTPRFTLDTLKIQKEEKQPLRQINNQLAEEKSKVQNSKKLQSYEVQEQAEYKAKCLNARYFSISLLCKDKEYDILISNAGGHFNFEIFKRGIETLQSLGKKGKTMLQKLFDNKQ